MSGRRSGRIKKQFDYTSLLENNDSDENDDDFVGNSAPPLKKSKSTQEENVKKIENPLTKLEKQINSQGNKKTKSKRKKLDEKLLERDIKMAMEMSMKNNHQPVSINDPESANSSCESQPESNEPKPHKELLYLSRHDIHSPPKSPPLLTLSVPEKNEEKPQKSANKQSTMPVLMPIMNGPSDDIEFLGFNDEEEKKQTRNRRTSGRTAKKTIIEYQPEDSDDDDDDSEFEEEESISEENSDFEEKPKNKKKKQVLPTKSKKENKKHSPHSASTRVQPKAEAKKPVSVPQKTETKKTVSIPQKTEAKTSISLHLSSPAAPNTTNPFKSVTKSATNTENINFTPSINRNNNKTVSNPVTSVQIPIKMKIWNPLGKSVNNLASPPNIRRLGLSRNQKVKPLHPALKVNH